MLILWNKTKKKNRKICYTIFLFIPRFIAPTKTKWVKNHLFFFFRIVGELKLRKKKNQNLNKRRLILLDLKNSYSFGHWTLIELIEKNQLVTPLNLNRSGLLEQQQCTKKINVRDTMKLVYAFIINRRKSIHIQKGNQTLVSKTHYITFNRNNMEKINGN